MDWCWFSSIIPRRPCKLPPKTGWSFSPRICAMPLKNGPCKVVCFGSQVEGVYTNLCYREATIFWLVVSNIFYVQPELLGRWTHFDEHIFQRGWNHQLYSFNYSPGVNWPVLSKKSVGKMSFWNPIGWDILVSWGVTKSIQIKSYMIIYIYMYIYICIYIYMCVLPLSPSRIAVLECVCVCVFFLGLHCMIDFCGSKVQTVIFWSEMAKWGPCVFPDVRIRFFLWDVRNFWPQICADKFLRTAWKSHPQNLRVLNNSITRSLKIQHICIFP